MGVLWMEKKKSIRTELKECLSLVSQALSDYASKGTTVSIWPAFDKWQCLCELIVFLIWHEMVMIIYKLNIFFIFPAYLFSIFLKLSECWGP